MAIIASVALILTATNFGYQLGGERDWEKAFERSWFQVWALIALAVVQALR